MSLQHQYIPYIYPSQMVDNRSYPVNIQGYEGDRYFSIYIWRSSTIFMPMAFNVHLLWMEEGEFLECHPI